MSAWLWQSPLTLLADIHCLLIQDLHYKDSISNKHQDEEQYEGLWDPPPPPPINLQKLKYISY